MRHKVLYQVYHSLFCTLPLSRCIYIYIYSSWSTRRWFGSITHAHTQLRESLLFSDPKTGYSDRILIQLHTMSKRPRHIACRTCRERKIRCDGQQPCSRCAGQSQSCVYTTPSSSDAGTSDLTQQLQMMNDRLSM